VTERATGVKSNDQSRKKKSSEAETAVLREVIYARDAGRGNTCRPAQRTWGGRGSQKVESARENPDL